jgi:hypothetical protein
MEFLNWLKLFLALVLVAMGLFVLTAWALLRQFDRDEDRWP